MEKITMKTLNFEDLTSNSHLWSIDNFKKKEYTIEEFSLQTYTSRMYRKIIIKDISNSRISHFWIPPKVSSIHPSKYFSLATSLEEAKEGYIAYFKSEIEFIKKEIIIIKSIK